MNRLQRILFPLLILLLLSSGLYTFARFARQIIAFPYPVDYGEGPLLSQVGRLAHGENLYTADLSQAPYTITNYPPLYMLLQAPFYVLFGPAFWYGRLLSLLGMCAAALFLSLTVHHLTQDRLAGFAAGLLLFSIPYVRAWAPLCRVDPLALGLSWGGLYLLARGGGKHGLAGAAILLTAAIYTRQSYGLAAPLAGFAWLLGGGAAKLERRLALRQALTLAVYVGGLGLSLLVLLNLLTSGGFFYNIVTANINAFQLPVLKNYLQRLLTDLPILLLTGGAFLVFGWVRGHPWRMAAPYLVGALLSALTIGKIGSNVNYLLELCAALCLSAGLVLAWLRQRRQRAEARPAHLGWGLAVFSFALLLGIQAYWGAFNDSGYNQYLATKASLGTLNEVLLKRIEQSPGRVLTGEHMGLLALAERPIYYQPFEMKQLSDSNVWDQTAFLAELARGDYPLILMYRPPGSGVVQRRWTPEMLDAITRYYRPTDNFDQTVVYEWKK